jgi:hypothetical protein
MSNASLHTFGMNGSDLLEEHGVWGRRFVSASPSLPVECELLSNTGGTKLDVCPEASQEATAFLGGEICGISRLEHQVVLLWRLSGWLEGSALYQEVPGHKCQTVELAKAAMDKWYRYQEILATLVRGANS